MRKKKIPRKNYTRCRRKKEEENVRKKKETENQEKERQEEVKKWKEWCSRGAARQRIQFSTKSTSKTTFLEKNRKKKNEKNGSAIQKKNSNQNTRYTKEEQNQTKKGCQMSVKEMIQKIEGKKNTYRDPVRKKGRVQRIKDEIEEADKKNEKERQRAAE